MKFHEKVTRLLRELRRRKVFHVGSVYLLVAWGASLGAADLLPAFGVSDAGVRTFIILAALGFPVAVGFAWIYEISSEGIRLDPKDIPIAARPASNVTTRLAGTASLRVSWQGSLRRETRSFANRVTIGRDPNCEICLNDDMVSRRHAQISVHKGVWHIEDLGSRNGTRLNGVMISQAVLPPSSEVVLYPQGPVLEVEILDETAKLKAVARSG